MPRLGLYHPFPHLSVPSLTQLIPPRPIQFNPNHLETPRQRFSRYLPTRVQRRRHSRFHTNSSRALVLDCRAPAPAPSRSLSRPTLRPIPIPRCPPPLLPPCRADSRLAHCNRDGRPLSSGLVDQILLVAATPKIVSPAAARPPTSTMAEQSERAPRPMGMDPPHITEFASERYFEKLSQLNAQQQHQPPVPDSLEPSKSTPTSRFILPLRESKVVDVETVKPSDHKKEKGLLFSLRHKVSRLHSKSSAPQTSAPSVFRSQPRSSVEAARQMYTHPSMLL